MRRVSYAEDRAAARGCERPEPHVPVCFSAGDGCTEGPKCVQCMPHRSDDGMGGGCDSAMGERIAVAGGTVGGEAGADRVRECGAGAGAADSETEVRISVSG